jgi:hypothetical protein
MTTRRTGIAAATAVLFLFSLFATPAFSATEKETGLVVEGWEIVGNKVMVNVSNPSKTTTSGRVEVRAVVAGLPLRSTEEVRLGGGTSEWVTVGFIAQVDGVIVCGISDHSDPVT